MKPAPTPVPSVRTTRSRVPRPAPWTNSASAAALPSLMRLTGSPSRCSMTSASGMSWSLVLTAPSTTPVRVSIRPGTPSPTPAIPSVRSSSTVSTSASTTASWEVSGVGRSVRCSIPPGRSSTPARIFVPPRSIPITCVPCITAGTLLRRMAQDDKPYRVYRGGRVKGKVPAVPGTSGGKTPLAPPGGSRGGSGGGFRRPRLPRRPGLPGRGSWKQIVLLALLILVVLVIVWGVTGFLAFEHGVSDANKRFDHDRGARAALSKSNGFLLTHATAILLIGTDSSTTAGRSGDRHADSLMIIRTDPSHHRLAYLSLPRDLLVPIPGVGSTKINASYQYGGAALAVKTVRNFTGIPIDHVVEVDFNSFRSLI